MADGERDWLRPEVLAEATPREGSRPAMYELRPLSLGEILDRTFALYRSRFPLFASISAVAASVHVVVQAISLTAAHTLFRSLPIFPGQLPPRSAHVIAMWLAAQPKVVPRLPGHTWMVTEISAWVAGLVYFLVAALTQAATSLALSQVYLAQPTSAKASLRNAARRWSRWIGIALWQVWSLVYVPVLALVPALVLMGYGSRTGSPGLTGSGGVLMALAILGGFPLGVVLYLRNALAIPAAVVERLTVRAAIRRSKGLSAGSKGQIFVVLLIAGCLLWVVAALESPASFLIMLSPQREHVVAQTVSLFISFLGRTVVAPVAMIGLTLVYFDQRVRKEALDLQLLMESDHGRAGSPMPMEGAGPELAPLG